MLRLNGGADKRLARYEMQNFILSFLALAAASFPRAEAADKADGTATPGETKRVEFTVPRDQFAIYNVDMKFTVEPGTYTVYIGPNSAEGLEVKFTIRSASVR